jgi:hypothetical protein
MIPFFRSQAAHWPGPARFASSLGAPIVVVTEPPAAQPAWSSNLYTSEQLAAVRTGQVVAVAPSDMWTKAASGLALAGTGLGVYHGYKRTGSLGWALAWGLLGGMFPIITIPVALAQGFARPSPAFRKSGASRRT